MAFLAIEALSFSYPGRSPVVDGVSWQAQAGEVHYLPAYAGNLDIMTSAGLRTAEHMAARMLAATVAA